MQKPILHRVRPATHNDSDEELSDGSHAEAGYLSSEDGSHQENATLDNESEDEDESVKDAANNSSEEEDDPEPDLAQASLSTISFGALRKAHTSLEKDKALKKRPGTHPSDRVAAVKSQLRSLKATQPTQSQATSRPSYTREKPDPPQKRTSKSAPTEMTSKRPVSRFREAVALPATGARDPRFDAAIGPVNEDQFRKNYGFLKEYRDSEIGMIRESLGKVKEEREKERLKKVLRSMVRYGADYGWDGSGVLTVGMYRSRESRQMSRRRGRRRFWRSIRRRRRRR